MAATFNRSASLRPASPVRLVVVDDGGGHPGSWSGGASSRVAANWLDLQILELTTNPQCAQGRVRAVSAALDRRRTIDAGVNGAAKRGLDIVVALLALVFAAPLMAIVALAVVLDSPGPILFRQTRNGLDRRPFRICKFRTMKVLEDGDIVMQAKDGDDRITRIGEFLRRSSLDELPQLFNVLTGDMSIVGPRPHAKRHDVVFERHLADYQLRYRCKPGIIGLAQLNGARGEIRCRRDIVRRTKLDLLYQRRWSLLLDVQLIASTPFRLLRDALDRRAY